MCYVLNNIEICFGLGPYFISCPISKRFQAMILDLFLEPRIERLLWKWNDIDCFRMFHFHVFTHSLLWHWYSVCYTYSRPFKFTIMFIFCLFFLQCNILYSLQGWFTCGLDYHSSQFIKDKLSFSTGYCTLITITIANGIKGKAGLACTS